MSEVQSIHPHYDAVVVGARCAGAATAMLLARAGARVLAVDRQAYGSDTMSTHALMRPGILQLVRWGLVDELVRHGTPPVRRTTFGYGDDEIVIDIKPGNGVDALYGPRRTVLDRILVDAAVAAGAEVRHGVSLNALQSDAKGRVTGAVLRDSTGRETRVGAGIVIGADGRQSSVADMAGVRKIVEAKHWSAAVFGYFGGIEDKGYRWHYQPGMSAAAIPTNDGNHCVFVSVPPAAFSGRFRKDIEGGFQAVLDATAPGLGAEVKAGRLDGRLRGFAGLPGYYRESCGPGWALVGDAAYFKDPMTAHGITDALIDAEILARAVQTGSERAFAIYGQERAQLTKPLFEVTEAIASFEWNLEDIRHHHTRLSEAMQAETDYVAAFSSPTPLAA